MNNEEPRSFSATLQRDMMERISNLEDENHRLKASIKSQTIDVQMITSLRNMLVDALRLMEEMIGRTVK